MKEKTQNEEILSAKTLKESMNKKGDEFKKIFENNPDKRFCEHRLVIKWAELVDVKKSDLRFEENSEDENFNAELIKSKSSNCNNKAMEIAAQIQDNSKFCITELQYGTNVYKRNSNISEKDIREVINSLFEKVCNGKKNKEN